MKKFTKIALIVALCCIGAGLLLAIPAMRHANPEDMSINLLEMVSSETEEKSIPIPGEIHSIEIEDISCNVRVLPSADGQCRVDYTDNDQYTHQIEFDGGKLSIEVEGTGDWSNRFVSVQGEEYVNVYLMDCVLDTLNIETISGDIEVASDISVQKAQLASISGNILCNALVRHQLETVSTSGNIKIDSTSSCRVDVQTTSGDISLENLSPVELRASTTSADLELRHILVEEAMELNTASGNIELHEVDAHTANLGTASGDVDGSVLSAKHFTASTVSGSIQVPDTYTAEETWSISTVSGDIEIEILE